MNNKMLLLEKMSKCIETLSVSHVSAQGEFDALDEMTALLSTMCETVYFGYVPDNEIVGAHIAELKETFQKPEEEGTSTDTIVVEWLEDYHFEKAHRFEIHHPAVEGHSLIIHQFYNNATDTRRFALDDVPLKYVDFTNKLEVRSPLLSNELKIESFRADNTFSVTGRVRNLDLAERRTEVKVNDFQSVRQIENLELLIALSVLAGSVLKYEVASALEAGFAAHVRNKMNFKDMELFSSTTSTIEHEVVAMALFTTLFLNWT